MVSNQFVIYIKDNDLRPGFQSAYRAIHSTDAAVLLILADILLALDYGDQLMLTPFNLSAAFDSVDHDTLIRRLQTTYCVNGVVINLFASYLSSQLKHVRVSESRSSPSAVLYDVIQGSVLWPILFLLYTADLLQLVKHHQLHPHAFADDSQINRFCQPSAVNSLREGVHLCWWRVVVDEG